MRFAVEVLEQPAEGAGAEVGAAQETGRHAPIPQLHHDVPGGGAGGDQEQDDPRIGIGPQFGSHFVERGLSPLDAAVVDPLIADGAAFLGEGLLEGRRHRLAIRFVRDDQAGEAILQDAAGINRQVAAFGDGGKDRAKVIGIVPGEVRGVGGAGDRGQAGLLVDHPGCLGRGADEMTNDRQGPAGDDLPGRFSATPGPGVIENEGLELSSPNTAGPIHLVEVEFNRVHNVSALGGLAR